MKAHRLTRHIGLSMIIALTALAACKKRTDYEVPCKIKKMIAVDARNAPWYDTATITFNYNYAGDPVSLIFDETTTGQTNTYFYYDSQRRLIRKKEEYGPGNVEYLTRYKYDGNNFITSDTTWFQGTNENDVSTFYMYFVSKYSYDAEGRISQIVETDSYGHITVRTFTYDANGNRVAPNYTYDNKVNFLRTNLVLAFVYRDYSKNNYKAALTYNRKGLPSTYPNSTYTTGGPAFKNIFVSKIEYTCD